MREAPVETGASRRRGRVPGLRPYRYFNSLLNGLAVQREIETFALHLFRHAQADEDIDYLQDDERDDGAVDDDDGDAQDLIGDLAGIVLEEAGGAAILLDGKHAGQDRADHAPDRMHAEAVERVVVAEHALETGCTPVAEDAGRAADRERADRT